MLSSKGKLEEVNRLSQISGNELRVDKKIDRHEEFRL